MADKHDNPLRFWEELKRRKVMHIITVYIAAAFSLLEITDILSGPLNWSGAIVKIVLILLIIGFPIALIISWFFVVSADGIRKRKSLSIELRGNFQPDSILKDHKETEIDLHPDDLVTHIVSQSDDLQQAKQGGRAEKVVRISSLGIIGLVIILFLFYGGKSIEFDERDWIVICDFENYTDETIFNNSLNTGFIISINQSRYVNVITRQRINETLKRMQIGGIESIDEETGMEIAQRESIKICILPGISKVGTQYILTAKILDAGSGETLRSEILYAENQDEIIAKMDLLSKRIRRALGESRYKISGQNKPLSKVTTSSLEALKQFSIGSIKHCNLEFEDAVRYYENAINIDTNFTSAIASLGNIQYERFDREKGRKLLDKAILAIDNLADIERYGILAFYAANIENDLDKAISLTNTLVELYPDRAVSHNNLGWYYQNLKQYEKAVEEYKLALKIDPYLMISYSGVLWVYLGELGQIDSALVWSKRMVRYGPDNPWSYFNLGSSYIGKGDFDNAEKALLRVSELNPALFLSQYNLAHLYRIQERYEEAIEVLNSMLEINDNEAGVYYNKGIIYEMTKNYDLSRKNFLKFRDYAEQGKLNFPQNPISYIKLGIIMTRLGEKEAGWELGKKAIKLDSTIHLEYAGFLAVQGKITEANDHLEKALENGYGDIVWLKVNPDLCLLQNEPKFKLLLKEYFKNMQN